MKKVLLSLAVMAIATTAMGQAMNPALGQQMNPVIELPYVLPAGIKNVKEENLKGNVLAVKYSKYVYKENFGEPQAGEPYNYWTTYFDENGRSIIQRTVGFGSRLNSSSEVRGYSYLFEYTQNGEELSVTALGIESSRNSSTLEQALLSTDGFEALLSGASNKHEMKFTKNGILVLHNYYSLRGTLEEKLVGKQNADKTWTFTKYKESGDACEVNTRTFNTNGQLTKLEYSQYGPNNNRAGGEIKTPPAGTYGYDVKGRWISFQEQKAVNNMKYQLIYNDHGDFTHAVATWTKRSGVAAAKNIQQKDESKEYSDYVYDSHGNWISRVVWNHQSKPRFIEKREIIYCDSKEELKEKAAQIYESAGGKIKAHQK